MTVAKTVEDAVGSYTGMRPGAAAQFALPGGDKKVAEQVKDDLLGWGDDSRTSLPTVDGAPIGNIFLVRKGNAIFHALFVGVCFDDAEAVKALLQAKPDRLEASRP